MAPWFCKICKLQTRSRFELIKHFRLKHSNHGRYPCPYSDCPCEFRTWNSFQNHVYRHNKPTPKESLLCTFVCELCACNEISNEREYFGHVNEHLRNQETVTCLFKNCEFKTNIYNTFQSHKNRKHKAHKIDDFRPEIVSFVSEPSNVVEQSCASDGESEGDFAELCHTNIDDLGQAIERHIALLLLKLEHVSLVPATVIDGVLSELHDLLSSASVPITCHTLNKILDNHNVEIDELVVQELTETVCRSNPLSKAFAKDGPLATGYKRKKYFAKHFNVVNPVEYILDLKSKRTFQYIPILQSLQHLLSKPEILNSVTETDKSQRNTSNETQYKSIKDGQYYKENIFFSGQDLKLSISLYVDDFEVCNPIGTSRKTHKLCGLYWILNNLPPGSHSSLGSIYLATLCKSTDVKDFGFECILEPLLKDLVTLEKDGVFIAGLGQSVKGTVVSVIADNLGAHGMAGFIESFSGSYFCRFCTGTRAEIHAKSFQSGQFDLRTKEMHEMHVTSAHDNSTICYGVKRPCVLSKTLSHFHVTKGYPPDIVHDLLEGLVPLEVALCVREFISKKYFSLEMLNKRILNFPYKWADKTNKPHVIPPTYTSSCTIRGNAHENWNLLRLFPFIIGDLIPEGEPAWLVLLDLKEIVELAVAPIHNKDSIAYFDFKITEHRDRFLEIFPGRLLPKHHFVEHYAQMTHCFGPLVSQWTMRFEAKHSFFKEVARRTNCFKNIHLTLANKHQQMIAYHLSANHGKGPLEVNKVSEIPVHLLKDEVAKTLKQKYPNISKVHLAKTATVRGITYHVGMLIPYGSSSGLTEFAEILQLCIVENCLNFIANILCAWHHDHVRAYELTMSPNREVVLLDLQDLPDTYPLCDYLVGGRRMVTLKRHIV